MICLYQINKNTKGFVMHMQNKMVYGVVIIVSFFFVHNVWTKTILVTGGAGFIGGTVTECLLKRGDTVIVVDCFISVGHSRAEEYNLMKRNRLDALQKEYADLLYIYECSIEDVSACEQVFKNHTIDAVCHLAAHAGVRASIEDPNIFIQTNIEGTINVLELAVKYGVNHCVLASSSSVYGDCKDAPFLETQNTDAQSSLYGATKKSLELIAQVYNHIHGISTTCLRFFTVYGPYGRFDMAPFIFMDAIYNQKLITVFGDGTVVRDFAYVDDIADGIIRSIDKPLGYQIFNLGSTDTIILNDFISLIEKIVGKTTQKIYQDFSKADVHLTQSDNSKAFMLLGYEPKVLLKDGLKTMLDWYVQVIAPEA